MGTVIKHSVPDWVNALGWASDCPDVKNFKWLLNPVKGLNNTTDYQGTTPCIQCLLANRQNIQFIMNTVVW